MSKINCTICHKNQPDWAFKGESDACMFCVKPEKETASNKPKHDYEVVEDKGCSGGGCTL